MHAHKYRAKKTRVGDLTFDSILEADLFHALNALQGRNMLARLECQPKVYLTTARILYKPDFTAVHPNGERVWFEAKGVETAVWRIKLRLWKAGYGPGRLQIYKRIRGRLQMVEQVEPAAVAL